MYAPTAYLTAPDCIKERAIAMSHISKTLSEKEPQYLRLPLHSQYEIILAIESSIDNKIKDLCALDEINYDWSDYSICQKYSAELYRILDYIKKYPCKDLLYDIEKCKQFATIPSRLLAPDEYLEIEAKIKLQQSQFIQPKFSTQYFCPKCHKRECSIEEVQLRSFDEGANISAKCVNCDYKWIAA